MKLDPKTTRTWILLLSVLVLFLSLIGDHWRSSNNSIESDIEHGHKHENPSAGAEEDALDQAFSQAPSPDSAPKNPERERRMGIFHYNEGNKFLNKGDWKEAVRNYKMALHHDKALKEIYINMSTAYLQGKQFGEAKQTLDTLQNMDPDNPHLHYNLACYFSLIHQEKESLQALKKAIQMGYPDREDVKTDPDLENLRQTAAFRNWIAGGGKQIP